MEDDEILARVCIFIINEIGSFGIVIVYGNIDNYSLQLTLMCS